MADEPTRRPARTGTGRPAPAPAGDDGAPTAWHEVVPRYAGTPGYYQDRSTVAGSGPPGGPRGARAPLSGGPPGTAQRARVVDGAPGRPRPPAGPGLATGRGYGPPADVRLPAEGRPVVVRDVRHRRVVRRVDVLSVAKVSFVFYLCVMVVVLVAGAILWNVASAAGLLASLDKLVRSLFALTSFQLHPLTALAWSSAVGLVLAIGGTIGNVVAALMYNLISDIVGGVQVVVLSDHDV